MTGEVEVTAEAEVRVGSTRPLLSRLRQALERTWEPGRVYAAATFVRPRLSTGFEYECTDPGQSASEEPIWPTTIGQTIVDGSVVWACRDQSNAAVDAVSTSDWAVTPSGPTISGKATNPGALETSAKFTGGTVGTTYEVRNTVTTASGLVFIILYKLTIIP